MGNGKQHSGKDGSEDAKHREKQKRRDQAIPVKTNTRPCSVKVVPVPPTPGATVWASFWNFSAVYKPNPSTGWGYCHNFRASSGVTYQPLQIMTGKWWRARVVTMPTMSG